MLVQREIEVGGRPVSIAIALAALPCRNVNVLQMPRNIPVEPERTVY
jgi:hypothetical protein